MAMAMRPRLLIADEPTTALDATIRAQILDLIRNLAATTGTAVLLITHDFGVVNEVADRVAVMYAGQIVEEGTRDRAAEPAAAPLYAGPAQIHPAAGGARDAARRDQRRGAAPGPMAGRPAASTRAAPTCSTAAAARSPRARAFRRRRPPGAIWSSRRCGHERAHQRCAAGTARAAHLVSHSHRHLQARHRSCESRRRRRPDNLPGRDAGAGGRVRLRQDHRGAHHPATGRSRAAATSGSTASTSRCCRTRTFQPYRRRCRS